MPIEMLQALLMFAGWTVAFLLGKELQTGYALWRARAQRSPRG